MVSGCCGPSSQISSDSPRCLLPRICTGACVDDKAAALEPDPARVNGLDTEDVGFGGCSGAGCDGAIAATAALAESAGRAVAGVWYTGEWCVGVGSATAVDVEDRGTEFPSPRNPNKVWMLYKYLCTGCESERKRQGASGVVDRQVFRD